MNIINFNEYINNDVMYGYSKFNSNLKSSPYIYEENELNTYIDLVKTDKFLTHAKNLFNLKIKKDSKILFVGTSIVASKIIKKYANKKNFFYINYRWFGGMLTNWSVIQKQIKKLKSLNSLIRSSEFKKIYTTKKEQSQIVNKLENLNKAFGGIKDLNVLPDLIIFINKKENNLPIIECNNFGIPSIAICDTNIDSSNIPYPIPGNEKSVMSLNYILNKLVN